MEAGIEACRRAGYGFVVVLGNEYGAQDEFMVLELRTGALAGLRGLVKYCSEFSELR